MNRRIFLLRPTYFTYDIYVFCL